MNLIVVESPAKAKTIKNFLGSNYKVIASKGHIKDLPKKKFGIKIEDNNFIPEYEVDKDHKAIAKEIKDLAKKSSNIYIATDEDREGEAIGYHIAQIIDKDKSYPRIVFHEITKQAILDSLKNPRNINMNMVNAQQARRLLDRIVGFKLSPLLNQKIQKGLSAGRVQSSALKLVVDREKEIKAFVPIKYFSIDANFSKNKDLIPSLLIEWRGKKIQKIDLRDEKEANEMLKIILESEFIISNIEIKDKKVSPPPPFMTSTLQQSASNILGYSPSKTMQIAQKLYEGVSTNNGTMGIITYMRTDSLNIAKIAQESARRLIQKSFGKNYIPTKIKNYTNKQKSAQEAHEAIRPTQIEFTPQIAKDYLQADELKIYTLIYNRFLASQSTDAIFQSQNVFFKSKDAIFKASGSKLVFDGFYKITGNDDKDKILPNLEINESIKLKECKISPHQTEPPARFSEASLVKMLESLGIGRPSTYAPTISLLSKREYIKIEKKQIFATEISFTMIDILQKHFLEIVDSSFTAKLEEKLDDIADSKIDWQSVLWEFYQGFIKQIQDGKENITSLKTTKPTGELCPECSSELVIRKSRFGEFVGCSGYPKCKYIKQDEKEDEKASKEICDKCGKVMIKKFSKNGEFMACSGYPKCKNTKSLAIKKEKKILQDIKCPECNGDIIEKYSRRGVFFGCGNYPKCKFISPNEPTNKKCQKCNYIMAKKETKTKKYFECLKCKYKEDL
ncbi:type I DNA topoisomerase [Helicobacter sp. MIT 14-3879]|uniref:type I DNA topoisomerase n=1 Tax=Helicobacter sp. MIT 14-3879 TaxID=2040649 RepID=UPI000E1EC04B|nr:type I DNA topoisomerase [Helicobacter sp. MIT 14-3879]RDU65563.1 type I DNA topoisomerase [Helicobacter sp. MIT 14-3879]